MNITLDKVSRNPEYYARLYRAVAKANPTKNPVELLHSCKDANGKGYLDHRLELIADGKGDLELDDELESPAEKICFRLLQLAVCLGPKLEPAPAPAPRLADTD